MEFAQKVADFVRGYGREGVTRKDTRLIFGWPVKVIDTAIDDAITFGWVVESKGRLFADRVNGFGSPLKRRF